MRDCSELASPPYDIIAVVSNNRLKYDDASLLSGILELPQTLYTGVCSVSLLILIPRKFWGSSGVGEIFVLLSSVAKNYE